jgi:hypothetical protein
MDSPHQTGSGTAESAPKAADTSALANELKQGPRGALFLAAVSVLALLAGWLAFYFFLFMPRGAIG